MSAEHKPRDLTWNLKTNECIRPLCMLVSEMQSGFCQNRFKDFSSITFIKDRALETWNWILLVVVS